MPMSKKSNFPLSLSLSLCASLVLVILFTLIKTPPEVKAIAGTLNVTATTGTIQTPGGIWNSSGNVGIGTTGPGAKLHVESASSNVARFYSSDYFGEIFVGQSLTANKATALGYNVTGGYTFLQTYGDPWGTFVIKNGGNVGIGTTVPGTKLAVAGDLTATGANGAYAQTNLGSNNVHWVGSDNSVVTNIDILRNAIFSANTGTTQSFLKLFGEADYGMTSVLRGGGIILNGTSNGNDGSINFYSSNSQKAIITSAGNVGIGTTGPNMSLHIVGAKAGDVNEGQGQLNIEGTAAYNATNSNVFSGSGAGGAIVFRGKYTSGGLVTGLAGIAGSKENITDANYGGTLRFYTRTHGANDPSEWMRITSTGNVGIGTTSPARPLDIKRDTAYNGGGGMRVSTNPGGTETYIDIGASTGSYGWIQAWYNNPGVSSGANPLLLQTNGGNVGIGTVGPQTVLDVNGRIRWSAGSWVQFNYNYMNQASPYIEVQSGYNSGLYGISVYASSRRFKKNITDLTSEVDSSKIYDLRPVTFNWKADKDGQMKAIGLIAEEVQQVFPQLVAYDKDGLPHHVDFGQLSVLELSELKKLRTTTENQQKTINSQQKQILELKEKDKKIEELQKQIELLKQEVEKVKQ